MSPDPTIALRAGAVYRAPSGRLCRWQPAVGAQRQITSYAVFLYLDQEPAPRHQWATGWAEGFHLTPANYKLLREEYVR